MASLGKRWWEWPDQWYGAKGFEDAFKTAVHKADRINVDVKGLDFNDVRRFGHTGFDPGTMTSAEMHYLRSNWGELGGKVRFFSGGAPTGVPGYFGK